VRGQVAVGMVSGCALPSLAELLADFHRRYPGVTIALAEDGSDRLLELLRDGTLDLALIGAAGPATEGVQTAVVVDDGLVAAVSPEDPLAVQRSVTVADLRDQPLVSLPRGTGVRTALDAACADAGFTPRIVLEASALPMVAQLAERGLGVAILPASAAPDGALRALPIGEPQLRSRLELAWNPAAAHSPAARALIEHTRAFAAAARRMDVPMGAF